MTWQAPSLGCQAQASAVWPGQATYAWTRCQSRLCWEGCLTYFLFSLGPSLSFATDW